MKDKKLKTYSIVEVAEIFALEEYVTKEWQESDCQRFPKKYSDLSDESKIAVKKLKKKIISFLKNHTKDVVSLKSFFSFLDDLEKNFKFVMFDSPYYRDIIIRACGFPNWKRENLEFDRFKNQILKIEEFEPDKCFFFCGENNFFNFAYSNLFQINFEYNKYFSIIYRTKGGCAMKHFKDFNDTLGLARTLAAVS